MIYDNLEKAKLELFRTSAIFLRILLARCCSTLHCYYMNNQGVTYLRGRSMYDFCRRAWPSVSVCIVVWFSGISTIPRKSSLVTRLESNTSNNNLLSRGFTLKKNSSFQTGFKVFFMVDVVVVSKSPWSLSPRYREILT